MGLAFGTFTKRATEKCYDDNNGLIGLMSCRD